MTERLRRYFADLRADLEQDSEQFFQRVMQKVDRPGGNEPQPGDPTRSH